MPSATATEAAPLRDQIRDATKDAMRDKDPVRLSTLRLMSAAIKDHDIAARAADRCDGIADAEILSILTKMVKQREEAARTYDDNGRPELAERERSEIEVVRGFMPAQMSEADIAAAVDAAVAKADATCLKDMGKVMGQLKAAHAGSIDMGVAGKLVKARLCS